MKKIIPISQPSITDLELFYITDAVKSGWVSSQGKYIDEFEQLFADYCGTRYALSTSSGTTALHLALVAYNLGVGDEVIVPDMTFVATANAVTYVGAKPIFVDINPQTLCIDTQAVEQAITPQTKAIIAVHMYGHPADMDTLRNIAQRHNLRLIEDAAEAHGATYKGRRTGSLSDCGAFSFYGNKLVTCGEGGMLTTNDEVFYRRARHLRDHAMSATKRYWHDEVGYNYRITNLQAALGVAQLQRIEHFLARKKTIFLRYKSNLSDLENIELNFTDQDSESSYWMIALQLKGYTESTREQLMKLLREKGVDSRPFFYPISDMPMYKDSHVYTPIAHEIAFQGINLPSYIDISNQDIDYICSVFRSALSAMQEQLLQGSIPSSLRPESVMSSAKEVPMLSPY